MRRKWVGRLLRMIALTSMAVVALTAAAEALPRVIHGAAPAVLVGEPISVDGPLLQIEVTPGIVVSVPMGAMLVLTQARENGDAFAVTVLKGPTLALNLKREEMRQLGVGTHLIGNHIATGHANRQGAVADAWTAPLESLPGYAALSTEQRQGMLLGDALMVRQQQYLDSLKIDVTSVNRLVVSIIRSMLPRP